AARVRVPLGAPACPAGAGASRALLTITSGGHESVHVVELATDVLVGINAVECDIQAVLNVAPVGFGPVESVDGARMTTTITVDLTDPLAAVVLEAVAGNVIFSVTPADGHLPLVIDPAASHADLPV